MGRAGCGGERGEQGVLVSAGGLADDEAVVIEPGSEGGERIGLVGDGAGGPVAAVEDDDGGLADIAAEDARGCVGG